MKSDCSALKSFFFSFSFSFLAQYIGEKRHTSAFPYKPLNPSCLSSFRGKVIFTIFSRRLGTGLIIDRPSFFSFSSRYECVCVCVSSQRRKLRAFSLLLLRGSCDGFFFFGWKFVSDRRRRRRLIVKVYRQVPL